MPRSTNSHSSDSTSRAARGARSIDQVEVQLRADQESLRQGVVSVAAEARALGYAVSVDGLQEAAAHRLHEFIGPATQHSGWRASLAGVARSAVDYFLPQTDTDKPAPRSAQQPEF